MGMVDAKNKVNFYDGMLRVVDPQGKEFRKFPARDYLKHVAEHVEPWSYIKFCYLKDVGWRGFEDGPQSGVYAVAPLARLNASDGMPTPQAQEAYEEFYATLGGKPVHFTLATHWARLVEMLCAAEMMRDLARDPGHHPARGPHAPHGHAGRGDRRGRGPARDVAAPLPDRPRWRDHRAPT